MSHKSQRDRQGLFGFTIETPVEFSGTGVVLPAAYVVFWMPVLRVAAEKDGTFFVQSSAKMYKDETAFKAGKQHITTFTVAENISAADLGNNLFERLSKVLQARFSAPVDVL
jgi:hypothetical protein